MLGDYDRPGFRDTCVEDIVKIEHDCDEHDDLAQGVIQVFSPYLVTGMSLVPPK